MAVQEITVNCARLFVFNQTRIALLFWGGVAGLIMFLMGYSPGLHAGNPYHIYHYPVLALAILYLFFVNKSYRLKFNFGIFPTVFGWFFLCAILVASIAGGYGYFSAIHVVSWHLGVILFWYLFFSRSKRHPINGIAIGWLSVVIVALAALLVGLFIQFVGALSLGALIFEQPLYRGFPYQRLISWFQSPNCTGPFFLYGFMGCVFLLHWANSRLHKLFLVISAIGLVVGIFLSGSRSAIGAFAIFLMIPFCFRTILSFHRLFIVLIVLVSLVGVLAATDISKYLISIVLTDRPWILMEESGIQIYGRSQVWDRVFEAFNSAPPIQQMLGMGPGTIITSSGVSSHSGWLTVVIEEGVVGFLLLFFFMTSLILQSFNRYLRLRQSPGIRTFFLYYASFWMSFAAMNVTTAIFPVPKLDNFVMLMVLAQFGVLNAAVRSKRKFIP